VMELGQFVLQGEAGEIAANEAIAASYLGLKHGGAGAVQ